MPMDHFREVRTVITKSMVTGKFAEVKSRFDFGIEAKGKVEVIKGRIVEVIDTGAKKSGEIDMGSNRVTDREPFSCQFDQIRIGYNLVIAVVLPDNYSFAEYH